jgi:hypothetical protein
VAHLDVERGSERGGMERARSVHRAPRCSHHLGKGPVCPECDRAGRANPMRPRNANRRMSRLALPLVF